MAMTPAKATHPKDADGSEGITVAIRMRPLNSTEDSQGRIWKVLPKYASVAQTTRDGKPLSERVTGRTFFTFDKTFGEETDNRQVYDSVAKGIVGSVVQGLNGTIFAYGQTSSGKTYTMQGSGNLEQGSAENSEGGLVHMAARDIFSQIVNQPDRMFLVRVSFLEIYNEEVRDLLAESNQKVQIREDPRRGVFVQSEEEIVTDFDSLLSILVRGDKSRTFAATGMNERSSRSHTILRITIESREKDQQNENEDDNRRDSISTSDGAVRVSTLNLVDLAGSESVRHTGATGERQKEGGLINQSLLTLSRVIVALGTPNQMHINFRDSKLTRILQPSLSGNARMAVICCATPSELYLEETRSTLQFASRAKLVKTNAQVNEVLDERSMIRRLQRELAEAKRNQIGADDRQVRALEKQIETAGTQAMEAKAKLDRLKSSILNAGYLFDQTTNESNKSRALESTRVSKKRRKSEGLLLIGHKTPSKESKHDLPTPKTAPRQKKIQTLYRPILPAEKELELVQKALAARNLFVRELNSTISQYTERVNEKNDQINRVMAENSSLNQQKSEVHAEVDKLREILSSMQASLESTIQENNNRTLEKEAELSDAFEKLQQSLGERNSIEEQLSELQTRFEEVHEERVRGAFELAQMTTEKENLLSERANDKQKLQDMAGKTEFLTSNLNEATEERDDALVEIKRLGQEMETVRIENDELQKSKDTKIADLEGQIERLRSETGQISESNTLLESHLGNAKETICSLTNQVSSLQNALKNQAEISDAERKSLESRVKEATAESEKLCTEKEASERLVVKLTSQLKDIDEKLQTQLAQNEERSAEIVEMTVRIESFVMEQNELKQSIERLQAENDKSSKANDALSLEKQALCEKLSELEDQNLSSKAEIETYKASVASLEQASQELRAKLETTETERSQLDESYRVSLLETSTRIEKLESDLSKAKNDLKIAQSNKEELLSKLEEQRNTFDNLETSHNELKLLFASLQAEKTERDEEFQVMSERLHAVNDEKDVVIAEKNSLEAVLTSYQQNVAEMEGLLEAAEGQISRLQKEKDASLAASSQSLQKIQKFATDMKLEKDRVAELEKMKTVLENLCEERQTTINAINAASEGLQGTVDMLMTERDSLKASVDNLEAKLSMSKTEALEKDAIAEELKTANITMTVQLQALSDDVEVRNKEIETLTASHLQATLETKELASRCDVLQEKVNRVSSENNDLCEKLSMAQEELEKNKNEMELMANDLSGSKELASQYDVLQEKVNGLSSENNHLCETLSLVQQQLEKNKNDMESMANELSGLRIDNSEAKEIICLLRRENEAATEEIIALQDQADAVWREAQSLEDRNAELERLHTTAQDDLNRARSKLEEICKELDAAFSSRETLAQSLRDCEAQRDEATLEVQDLFEKNRQLKEALTSSFPREKEQEFLTEIALLKTEIDELKDSLAYISDSESSLRCKIPQLEDELAVRAHDLKEARLRMSQLEEELTLEKQAKPNPEEAQPGLLQRLEELVNEKKELEHQLLEEEDRWKAREAETQKQMGEEQRALIQEGERLMADLRSKLQVCEEQRSQAESEAYTARQQVDEISDERKNLEERYLEVSEQVSSLDKVNSSLKFQITKLTSELGAAKSECYKLKESAIEMKDKMRKVTRESEKAIRDSEISSKEMVSLRKKVSNLERQIESEQVENAGLQKRCQDLEKQSRQMDSLKDDLKSNEILIGSLKKELSNLKLENDSLLEEMRKLKEAKKTPVRAKGGGKENNEHLLIQLQEQIEQQAEEMKQKDARIKKLQVAKMTKEQMQKVKDIMTENAELKKQCKTLQKDISRLKSQGSSCESEMELRTEVSALRMDKECLEKKVRKFAMHCQRLEDDKAGMKDALRSCNVKVDDYDGDLSEAVIQLCDRLTSVEETHAKKAASLEQRDDSLQKENKKLHHEIQQLTAQLHTSGLEINELSNSLKRRVGNSQEVGELKDKLGRLEEEYLQLMQDHKALKKVYHETKMKLDVAFTNVNAETTVDFSVLGASTAVQPSSSNNRSTRSSSAKEQSQTMEFSSDTMELTEMARRYAGHQAPSSSRMMVNAKQHSTKKNKRPALTESTNRSNHSKPEGTQEDSTGTKRQRREVTRLSRDEGAKRRTPGLGESSSAGGSASSENPAECNQS